jgi:hypothetical protein
MAEKNMREISWRAAEHEHVPKTGNWYLLMGAVALGLIIFSLWQKNFFFAVFIILASVMIFTMSRRKPQVFEFRLNEHGIAIGNRIAYDYDRLQDFSIRNRPGRLDELIIRRKTAMNPEVRMLVDAKTMVKIQEFLKDRLPEVKHEESLIDLFREVLGL